MMPCTHRRHFLATALKAGLFLTPLTTSLAACARSTVPEGMAEIKWDRDTCTECGMVLSDRRFAAQVKGGPSNGHYNFDDIGCTTLWLKKQAWGGDGATRIWVAALASRKDSVQWLDARTAQFVGGKESPMGYNFGAVPLAEAGSLDFGSMREHVAARVKNR